MSDVMSILAQFQSGDAAAADQLLPVVYAELRRLAAAKLAHERPGQMLQPTGASRAMIWTSWPKGQEA
jgi:ECF sigma factor